MNNLEQLLQAVQDYYKTTKCGVFILFSKGQYHAEVQDDVGTAVCTDGHDTLDGAIDRTAAKWLGFVSPTGALLKLAKAIHPPSSP